MKRLGIAVLAVALGFVSGCGDDNNGNPGGPSNTTVFTVNLLPSNEVPPVANAESAARGTAVITINSQTNTVDISVSVNSFPANSQLTLAHIHGPNAPAGVNASPVVNTNMTAGNAPALVNGAATMSFTGLTASTGDGIAQILANPQTFYFNVHSSQNPGGVLRGQLR